MPQDYNWVDDSGPNWVDDPPQKDFSWWDFMSGSIPDTTTKPDPSTYDFGTGIPGESHAPANTDYTKGTFWEGFTDIPREMYNYVDELGRRGAEQIRSGNLTGAANTIYDPLTSSIKQPYDILQGLKSGEITPEQGKGYGVDQVLGLTGLPVQSTREAWRTGDIPRLVGQGAGALTLLGGGHAASKAFEAPHAPVEAAPPAPLRAESFTQRPPAYADVTQGGKPLVSPEFSQSVLDFEAPVQPPLDFGAYRGARGRFTREGPGVSTKFGPEVGELPPGQQGFDFGEARAQGEYQQPNLFPTEAPPPASDISPMWAPPPEAPNPFVGPAPEQPNLRLPINQPEVLPPPRGEASPTNPVIDTSAPIFSEDGKTVSIPSPDKYTVTMLRNQGYVSVPDLRSTAGHVMMVRGDVAPLYLTGDKRAPVLGNERGAITLEGPEQPREGAMTMPSQPELPGVPEQLPVHGPQQDVMGLRADQLMRRSFDEMRAPQQQSMIPDFQDAEIGQFLHDQGMAGGTPTARSMAPVPKEPTRPQYPPGPLKPGETHQSRLAELRERAGKELDDFIEHGDDAPPSDKPTGIVDVVKEHVNKVLGNDQGVIDINELLDSLRGNIARLRELHLPTGEAEQGISNIERQQASGRERTHLQDIGATRADLDARQRIRVEESRLRQQEADIREVNDNTNLPRAREQRDYWQQERDSESRGEVNVERQRHAQMMLERAQNRIEELTPDPADVPVPTPVTDPFSREPRIDVFNAHTGETIGSFQTMEEVRAYIDSQPENVPLDYERIGPPEQPFIEVFNRNNNQVVGTFRDLQAANDFINQRNNPGDFEINDLTERMRATEARHPDESGYQVVNEHGSIIAETRTSNEAYDFVMNHPDRSELHYRATPRDPDPSIHRWEPDNSYDYDYEPSAREQKVASLRQATGVPNPKIEFGWQEPRKGKLTLTKEQHEKLFGTADEGRMLEAQKLKDVENQWKTENRERKARGEYGPSTPRPRELKKAYNTGNHWDSDAQSWIKQLDPGRPGLTITDRSGVFNKSYQLEYRAPDGRPVGIVKVSESNQGVRKVPLLGIDREVGAGLQGRAFKAFGHALQEMNALEPAGSISQFTARAIAKAAKLIGNERGSVEIGDALQGLKEFKEKVLKGGKEFKGSVMDLYASMVKNLPGNKMDLKWIADKFGEKTGIGEGQSDAFDPIQWTKEKTGWGMGESGKVPKDEINMLREALKVPAGMTTMLDLSAPGRQGLSLIATPEFWKASVKMFGALHYDTFKKMDAELRSKDIMVRPKDPVTGKEGKSIADLIGTKIYSPASEPGPHAEAVASRWLEMGTGKGPISKLYQHSVGYPIRASNRAFLTFLNELNINRTEKLMNLARDMSIKGLETGRAPMPGILGGIHMSEGRNIGLTRKITPEQAMDMNPYHNLVRGKEIADFVNTATGHGPLKTHVLPFKQAEVSLESASNALGMALFSPGLLASRIRMMNPNTYIMASPFVRKQYMKAALSTAAAWFIAAQMVKKAAGPEAEVGDDPTSADFGKVRIGDARMDLSGGFSQFATAYSRFYVGGATSSSTGQFHRFGSGYQADTQEDMMQRFFVNKLNPVTKFAYDVASASEYKPFHVGDRTMQMFIPLLGQDLWEIAKENPDLLPLMGGIATFGGGTQIYGKGESVGKFIDPENDWNVTGGGARDLMPWNWNAEPGEERNFPWSEQ